jgi:phosphoribosylaminoimidazole (AIR) synthetase
LKVLNIPLPHDAIVRGEESIFFADEYMSSKVISSTVQEIVNGFPEILETMNHFIR